jgi:hypothetical protein
MFFPNTRIVCVKGAEMQTATSLSGTPVTVPKIIQPSSTFYVQGSQGADAALPSQQQVVWFGALTRTEDLLVLGVTVWQKSTTEGFIAFDFPPQHIVESDTPPQVQAPKLQPSDPRVEFKYPYVTEAPKGPFVWIAPNSGDGPLLIGRKQFPRHVQWWADVAFTDGTRLCFHIPSGLDAVINAAKRGDVTTLLNWSSWDICLMPWGLSNASFQQHPRTDISHSPTTQQQAESATRLAMIFGMVLTPTDSGGWTHFDLPVTLGGRTELWHTRLIKAKSEPTLRAVWTLGQSLRALPSEIWDANPGPHPPAGDPLFVPEPDTALTTATSVSGQDQRIAVVRATSSMLPPTVAQEMPAQDTALSAMGGTLTTSCQAAKFHHSQILGRDVADSSVTVGNLCPFGHSVSVQNHRSRSVDPNGYAGISTIFTIRVIDPLRTCSPLDMRRPFSSVRLLTRVIPELNDNLKDNHGKPVLLSYEAIDTQGQAIRFELPLVLFGPKQTQTLFDVDLRQQHVGFASTHVDNTRFETDQLTILAPKADTPIGDNPFTVSSAVIRHPALQRFRTDSASPTITVTPKDPGRDELGTVAQAHVNAAVAVGSSDLNTAKFGAFASPDLALQTLSKTLGAAARSLDDLTDAAKAIQDLLGNTKILGIFSIANLLASGLRQAQLTAEEARTWLAENAPTITNTRSAQSLTVSVSLQATPPRGATEFSTSFSVAFLSAKLAVNSVKFNSRIVTALAKPQNSSMSAECVLTSPKITLGFGNSDPKPDLLAIQLKDLQFQTSTGSKPSFSTNFDHFQFLGDLAFLNGIMSSLPTNLFSNPPQLVIDDKHAEVDCSVALPAFGFGVFSFSNVGLDTQAIIRFDGSDAPLEFGFNFSTPQKPFSIVVSFLEGQGSFGMTIIPKGVTVDASLAFGGAFEIDLKVVKGGVALTAGIHLHKNETLDVGGFLHLCGGVELLGLIGITLDAMMSLSWNGSAFTGRVELTLTVDLLFIHKSVQVSFTKTFEGGSHAPSADTLAGVPQLNVFAIPGGGAVASYGHAWGAYCVGFAA